MASQKVGREIHSDLVAGVVDANLSVANFAIGKILVLDFDLLVGSPKVEVVRSGRIEEQERYGQDGSGEPDSIAPVGLQQRHTRQNHGEPDRGWQSQPGHGKECEDAGQTPGQIPGVAVKRAWGQFNLPAYGLSDGNEDVSDE